MPGGRTASQSTLATDNGQSDDSLAAMLSAVKAVKEKATKATEMKQKQQLRKLQILADDYERDVVLKLGEAVAKIKQRGDQYETIERELLEGLERTGRALVNLLAKILDSAIAMEKTINAAHLRKKDGIEQALQRLSELCVVEKEVLDRRYSTPLE